MVAQRSRRNGQCRLIYAEIGGVIEHSLVDAVLSSFLVTRVVVFARPADVRSGHHLNESPARRLGDSLKQPLCWRSGKLISRTLCVFCSLFNKRQQVI